MEGNLTIAAEIGLRGRGLLLHTELLLSGAVDQMSDGSLSLAFLVLLHIFKGSVDYLLAWSRANLTNDPIKCGKGVGWVLGGRIPFHYKKVKVVESL